MCMCVCVRVHAMTVGYGEMALQGAGGELSPTFLSGYGPCVLKTDMQGGRLCLLGQ